MLLGIATKKNMLRKMKSEKNSEIQGDASIAFYSLSGKLS
jgi:hypothetical protein